MNSTEAKDLQYTYTAEGVAVTWKGRGPRVVRYSQNLTQPLATWPTINVTHTSVQVRKDGIILSSLKTVYSDTVLMDIGPNLRTSSWKHSSKN